MTSPVLYVHKQIRRSDNMGADVGHELGGWGHLMLYAPTSSSLLYVKEELMYTYIFIIFLSVLSCSHSRLIEGDLKVNPLALNDLLSQIADSSMDEMRFRLRQAIYSIAFKKIGGGINDYEEWLLEQFIAQLTRGSANGESISPIENILAQ
ncbi:unnamed protein product [Cylicostephanus goldi]|uniref:Uncharacterized protein n=1 Tax=Cylicostephanus goldi TaxID=71465 RepID=A0A3P7MNH5_CYLGO|nr:unnamed protein product [Cylicostephanus goldi]